MNKLNGKIILLSIVFLRLNSLLACDCFPKPLKENIESADLVALVRIIEIEDPKDPNFRNTMDYMVDSMYWKHAGYSVKARAVEVFKGIQSSFYTVKRNWYICDYKFKKNKQYVVFGYINDDQQILI